MSGFEERGDWPEASLPIYKAVFEQLRTPEPRHPRSMVSWLAPWQWNAAGERVGAGPLDTDGYVLVEAEIDLDEGRFRYQWKPRVARQDDARLGFSLAPPEISDFLDDSSGLLEMLGLSDDGREVIRGRAEGLWHILSFALFASITITDDAKAWARVSSPLANKISAIPADVWSHFDVENWARGVAICHETEERLFSVRIELLNAPCNASPLNHADEFSQEAERREQEGEPPFTRGEAERWASGRGLGTRYGRDLYSLLPESQKLKPGQKVSDWTKDKRLA